MTDVVDQELERLIKARASTDNGTTADELEPSYAASVRRYNAAREAEMREAWCAYHRSRADSLRRTLEDLIARHEEQASKLQEGSAA